MPKAPRILWLLVLACFVGGCGSMRPARLPDTPAGPAAGDPQLPVVKVGNRVHVDLRDGTRVSGRLCALTAEDVIVEVDRGLGAKPRLVRQTIPCAEISAVAKATTDLGRTLLLVGGFAVGIWVIAAIEVAANGIGIGNGN